MATPGCLQYLQQYGFKTFSGLLNESYDTIQNSRQRLQAIITEMSRVANLPQQEKTQLFVKLNQIAEHNKHHFFNNFFDLIKQEYISNIDHSITTMNQHKTGKHDRNIRALMQ
jgi:ABC-type transporter MlaC component